MSKKITFANILTLIRIACIPLIVVIFFSSLENSRPLASFIFIVAAITDWLDGWVAREYNQISKLGTFLDPVADKLIVCVSLILIVQNDPTLINTVIAMIIIGREITISALREWMAEIGKRHQLSVIGFAKLKTALQMFGLAFMLFQESIFILPTYLLGQICLITAAVLTLWTMIIYMVKAWPSIEEK
ncbi:MAG: CDP-diacylglycerol--glycerol-3-phosphate 3-phosphatidyltransferase [Gammaproteobacteria bacterium]|jgi:CDP-diacylglycerol--glycerol-3-phosphate 3-phosphatidyltransferase|nr:CDP-diacylglycerol--glycerol-3-phosphate 3-phosphatidyltransferase [Gammaproteobacteria bacterium]MBT5541496.1 CDP-diacylglycerol--glycerol-3-phosphate 3-phosphatidyltransferase [Gammaproteobacteria bacterium]MBT6074145.1 CDP-diacylglycerol--glycerol-3-phosphate 3-phosphatidyltransferase [Gammaproteobacteria bacterium]MDG2434526.1 CDP-diacylglycerol--glycerol-3-phosphate 3-phosphatidyltransferase [Gammaproteobacteria bacterium]